MVRRDINSKKLNYIIICNKYAIEKEEENYKHFSRDIGDDIFINHSNESIINIISNEKNLMRYFYK